MSFTIIEFTAEQLAEIDRLAAEYRERVEGRYTHHTYHYKLHPDEPRLVFVRRNVPGPNWRWYGAFASVESAAIALDALQLAQAREQAEREEVTEREELLAWDELSDEAFFNFEDSLERMAQARDAAERDEVAE